MDNYSNIFTQYGTPREYAEINIRAYLTRPDKLRDTKSIDWAEKNAAELIARCENLITIMQQYRQEITARYGQLETMSRKTEIRLLREPHSDGIYYYLGIATVYEDGTENYQPIKRYPGKERKQAIEHFDRLCKDNPGAVPVKDIARRAWEK